MKLQLNIGADMGNGYTKYEGGRFASKVRVGRLSKAESVSTNSEVHEVTFKGKEYVLGDNSGAPFTGVDRYFTDYYLMALLTAIALSSKEPNSTIQANVVLGVPVDDYNSMADEISKHFNSIEIQEITVDGHNYTIELMDVTVFIEGGLPIANNDNRHIITVDVGAGTINTVEWKNQQIINKFTINDAFYKLHKDIIEHLNSKHKTKLLLEHAGALIGKTTMQTRNGVVEIPEVAEIVQTHISKHANTIEMTFDTDGCDVIQVYGGGSEDTFDYWKNHFPKAEHVKNAQHGNQRVYQAVANSMYED